MSTTPETPAKAACTRSACAALEITTIGVPAPAGKCRADTRGVGYPPPGRAGAGGEGRAPPRPPHPGGGVPRKRPFFARAAPRRGVPPPRHDAEDQRGAHPAPPWLAADGLAGSCPETG